MVSGRSILPGAAMFEAAFAAAAALLQPDVPQRVGLAGAAIAAPLLLSAPGSGGAGSLLLHVTVQQRDGGVLLSSRKGEGGRRSWPTVHLSGTAASLPAVQLQRRPEQQPAGAAAAAALLGASAVRPAAAAWCGEAAGCISQRPLQAADAYHCHPAAVDAATHFGAVYDLAAGGMPRVPVALGCYEAVAPPAGAQLHAAASAGRLQADGSRTSSFGVAAGERAALALAHLQSRPIGEKPAGGSSVMAAALAWARSGSGRGSQTAAAADPAAVAAAEALGAECCAYETAWQAAQPLAPTAPLPGPRSRRALRLRTGSGRASHMPASRAGLPQAALGSYSAALHMLQTLSPGKRQKLDAVAAAGGAQYGAPVTAPSSSASQAAACGAAAVGGLLKVAALEEPPGSCACS